GWIRSIVEDLGEPAVAAAGAPYEPPHGATWVQRVYDSLRDHRPGRRDVRWLGSGNLAVVRSRFVEVGGFSEALATCEDVDLCFRLRERGFRILSDSRVRSVHHGDPRTIGELFRSELWRGRSNLAVSLRSRPRAGDLPSILMPIGFLGSLALVALGIATTPFGGASWAAAGLAGIGVVTGLRTARMVANSAAPPPAGILRVLVVAAVYEAARALALVIDVRHRRVTAARAA
ncbi:MAG: hypothetical protein ACREQ9_07135, partial [Candidatus Binatia bacterium]